jgi:transmembrane 9 superfamily protein 2/4
MKTQPKYILVSVLLALLSSDLRTSGFYVPGVAPTDFKKGDEIGLKAIKMTSSHTQLPYEYYSLPFCKPKGRIILQFGLDELIFGSLRLHHPFSLTLVIEF